MPELAGRISTSETERNRCFGSMPSEWRLYTVSVSKAVIPLTAKITRFAPIAAAKAGISAARKRTSPKEVYRSALCSAGYNGIGSPASSGGKRDALRIRVLTPSASVDYEVTLSL
jgi:hypothetical protein